MKHGETRLLNVYDGDPLLQQQRLYAWIPNGVPSIFLSNRSKCRVEHPGEYTVGAAPSAFVFVKIVVIRHGETSWSASGRSVAALRTSNSCLSPAVIMSQSPLEAGIQWNAPKVQSSRARQSATAGLQILFLKRSRIILELLGILSGLVLKVLCHE